MADQIVGQIETVEQLEAVEQTVEQIEKAEKVAEQSRLCWSDPIGSQ